MRATNDIVTKEGVMTVSARTRLLVSKSHVTIIFPDSRVKLVLSVEELDELKSQILKANAEAQPK